MDGRIVGIYRGANVGDFNLTECTRQMCPSVCALFVQNGSRGGHPHPPPARPPSATIYIVAQECTNVHVPTVSYRRCSEGRVGVGERVIPSATANNAAEITGHDNAKPIQYRQRVPAGWERGCGDGCRIYAGSGFDGACELKHHHGCGAHRAN